MANEKNLIPFVKGDSRINRKGRPKNFDAVRELARDIGYRPADIKNDPYAMSRLEAILEDWFTSKSFQKQLAAVQYAYGKVPDKLEVTKEENRIIVEWNEYIPEGIDDVRNNNLLPEEIEETINPENGDGPQS